MKAFLTEIQITPVKYLGGNEWCIRIRMGKDLPLMEGDAIPAGILKNGIKTWKVDKILGTRPSILFKDQNNYTIKSRLIID